MRKYRVDISDLVETLDIMTAHGAGIWFSCLKRKNLYLFYFDH